MSSTQAETRESVVVESGTRLTTRLTLADLEAAGGVIGDDPVDSGWGDDEDAGDDVRFLPCSAAFDR